MAAKLTKSRRKLTSLGKVVLLTTVLSLAAAWNTGTNLYYLVFSGLASFLVVSWFSVRWTMRHLAVRRNCPGATHCGAPFSIGVTVENRSKFLPALFMSVEPVQDHFSIGSGYAPAIPAGAMAELTLRAVYEKRGVYTLTPMRFVSTFPFGLIACWRELKDHLEIVVYPPIVPARIAMAEQAAYIRPVRVRTNEIGDEFHSLRDYVLGDDLRFVAWRASARIGRLLVREFGYTSSRTVLFAFDSRYDPNVTDFSENFEEAVITIASLASTLLARQYKVAILTADSRLKMGEGNGHLLRALDLLARVQPAPADAPDAFSEAEGLDDARGAVHILVSPDPSQWGMRTPTGAHILDPREVIHA